MNKQHSSWLWRSILLASALWLTACASGPKVRTDQAPNVDLSSYQTFGFMTELATDRAGYTSLVTQHLKAAITAEMTARGYRLSDDPQLLINFNSNVAQRSEVRSTTSPSLHPHSYYYYRRGLYAPFPYYQTDVETVHYRVGTVNIDLVDASRKQLVWEGIAEGVLSQQDLQQPRESTARVVNHIFQQFPSRR